jgi:DNA polymerase-1
MRLYVKEEKPRKFLEAYDRYQLLKPIADRVNVGQYVTNGICHPKALVTGAAGARISMASPNLLNLHRKDNVPDWFSSDGFYPRNIIQARDGHVFVGADYEQAELRVLASYSRDSTMVELLRSGVDIHRYTASQIFGKSESDVTDSERGQAKSINFGIAYGMTAVGLRASLIEKGIFVTDGDAAEIIEGWAQLFSGAWAWLTQLKRMAIRNGIVSTWFGHIRNIPRGTSAGIRSNAERLAVNTPIQATAAHITYLAQAGISRFLGRSKVIHFVLNLFDALYYEVVEDTAIVSEFCKALEVLMSHPWEILGSDLFKLKEFLIVPYPVKISIGKRFGELS